MKDVKVLLCRHRGGHLYKVSLVMVALSTRGGQPCGNIRQPNGLRCVGRGQAVKDLMPFNHIGKRDDGQVKLYSREGKEASGGDEAVTTAGAVENASVTTHRTAATEGKHRPSVQGPR